MTSLIEDYAMIGDCKTAALVSRTGSIDWLCLPRFDSPACFSSLIGMDEHGAWRIAPSAQIKESHRRYLDGSLILMTEFRTSSGRVEVIDFMPIVDVGSYVIRIVRGVAGRVGMQCSILPRFGYGEAVPWIERPDKQTAVFVSGPDMLILRSDIPLDGEDRSVKAEFTIGSGETISFILTYGASYLDPPWRVQADDELDRTQRFWSKWSSHSADAGRWSAAVKRSLVTLKGLTYAPSGGIVAAATTSLPEMIGGSRNWDYRYCWIRDAAFTLFAFLRAGHHEEAHSFRDWLLRAVAGKPEQMQIMYGVGGERNLDESELPWLPGYEKSSPVRIGNDAAVQAQLDIYGEVFAALTFAMDGGFAPVERSPKLRRVILEHLEKVWSNPDNGIWEIRGSLQHFTFSKVMAWVAFDRAANHAGLTPDEGERTHYRKMAARIHAEVCERAFNIRLGCFTQAYGSPHMDAALLLLPIVGFVSASDERMLNTVAEIERRLLRGGFVSRYDTDTNIDGLPPGEGVFLPCSFWLVENYALQHRFGDAEKLFDRLLSVANDVGLLAEEYDPKAKRLLGNFPQALSHVAMVNAAFALIRARQGVR
ncbi:glycoside hydrolase family 15 protein [Rhodopila sp.]|uniref:glycoside hydrolase family 15 protein n=1 Tax=Rhodopila sp. TaxID=2480087 RepID=UPI002C43EABF|nr:glycoside hydrolase family 15 protein [Rhodopila sp.]HVZ06637.1 glycoside hydrolase family 15 protein [Rhodopila sp.]